MPSSTSSSEPLPRRDRSRGRAVRHAFCFLILAGIHIGLDAAVARDQRVAEGEAWIAVTAGDPANPRSAGIAADGRSFLSVLSRTDSRSILFVGNSIVATATVPAVLEAELGVAKDVRVQVLTLPGTESATILLSLERSGRLPAMAVVDISPRSFLRANARIAKEALRGDSTAGNDSGEDDVATLRRRLSAVKVLALDVIYPILPRLDVRHSPSEHFEAVSDAFRFGYDAYRCASFGNVTSAKMLDGSTRAVLLNRTPGYRRFRDRSIRQSVRMVRAASANADSALDSLLEISTRLAARGCRVALVNFPLDSAVREIDRQVNGSRLRQFEERVASTPGLVFVDLGADPKLASLPFYDGHHREYDVARKASVETARLLRPCIPVGLR